MPIILVVAGDVIHNLYKYIIYENVCLCVPVRSYRSLIGNFTVVGKVCQHRYVAHEARF